MTFCDINFIAEVSHLFQWAANNLYRKRSFENEFITEANAYAKFQTTSILISIAFLFTFDVKLLSILRK